MSEAFNPMKGIVAESNSGGLPVGNYVGVFKEAEYLPEQEPDGMTGEGGRKWAQVRFKWELTNDAQNGEHKGKTAIRETPCSSGTKSSYIAICGLIVGKQLTAGAPFDLTAFVSKKYLLTVANKVDKNGVAKNWTHVSNAMLVP